MRKKWSWLNADKTEIVRTITNGNGIMSAVGGRQSGNFADAFLLASGALPHEVTPLGTHEKYATPISYVIEETHIGQGIIQWTQEEIDTEALREATEELFDLTEANAELAYWVEKTPQDVTDIITAAPNTFVSFKQMIEKNSQSIRVIAIFLKLLRDTGRIG